MNALDDGELKVEYLKCYKNLAQCLISLILLVVSNSVFSIDNSNITKIEAARFLAQGTFGPSMSDVEHIQSVGYEAWIDEQVSIAPSYHAILQEGAHQNRNAVRITAWMRAVLWGEDQLRQRLAYALSEILIVSQNEGELIRYQDSLINYYDQLVTHGLGNYRDLLGVVSLNPVMAEYLSFSGNAKSEGAEKVDENYARELLQLFTIGIHKLNLDGTLYQDELGNPVANYTQDTVEDLAKVFTGWCYKDPDQNKFCNLHARNLMDPLEPWEKYHDTSTKILFGDQTIPAGQTAQEDMDAALDIIFAHPNVAPYISKLLIQRLVTSNPTPSYVARVAAIFNDNGIGVKGDLTAVAKAILLDDEARTGHLTAADSFGKMREPITRMTHFWRALDVQVMTDILVFYYLQEDIGQAPLTAPSVFNFYPADFTPEGLSDFDLIAPEAKFNDESSITTLMNYFWGHIYEGIYENTTQDSAKRWRLYSQYQPYVDVLPLENGVALIIERINTLFTYGQMSTGLQQAITDLIEDMRADTNHYKMMAYVFMLVFMSPEFSVQR